MSDVCIPLSDFSIWEMRGKDDPHPPEGQFSLNCFCFCPPQCKLHKASPGTLLQGWDSAIPPAKTLEWLSTSLRQLSNGPQALHNIAHHSCPHHCSSLTGCHAVSLMHKVHTASGPLHRLPFPEKIPNPHSSQSSVWLIFLQVPVQISSYQRGLFDD